MFNDLQLNLIQSSIPNEEENEIVNNLINGETDKILLSEIGKYILTTPVSPDAEAKLSGKDVPGYISIQASQYINDFSGDREEAEFNILCLAIACLNATIQNSFTGPLVEIKLKDLIPFNENLDENEIKKSILKDLSVDAEEIFHLMADPIYILLAISLLNYLEEIKTSLITFSWWYARCLFLQQRMLENYSGTLNEKIINNMNKVIEVIPDMTDNLYTRYYIEFGIVYHFYGKDQQAYELFKKAQEKSNFKWEVTGALGKRTKFQQENIPQLVIMAESDATKDEVEIDDNVSEMSSATSFIVKDKETEHENKKTTKPETLDLNDEVLLENISFEKTENDNEKSDPKKDNIRTIDQCLLLAFCLNVKNTNPMHGITNEQMAPYVRRVLANPNNWMVHTMGLLLRSRLESTKTRTMERGVLQLQALVDQIVCLDSTAGERLEYFYSIIIPPKWELERELADRFVKLGVVLTALEIYERLEMWEQVIGCYQAAEKNDKAEAIVREQLEHEPESPKFWCLLGQIKNEPEYYIKAWELSGHHYARAMRSLGAYYYKKLDYANSVDAYKKALKINPLFEGSWFILGCASMNIEDWDTAIEAWNRVISLESDHGEAWNNLASVYSKKKEKRKAWKAFQEAIKHKYDSPRIWMNYLYASIDLGEFNAAIKAMTQIVDQLYQKEPKNAVDIEILEIIVNSISREIKDCNGNPIESEKVENLLDHITSKIANNLEIFKICGNYWIWKKDYRKALDYKLKAYRITLHDPNLLNETSIFEKTATMAIDLVEDYQNYGSKDLENGEPVMRDWIYQSKMILRTLIGRTKSVYEGTLHHDMLRDKLKEIQTIERESR